MVSNTSPSGNRCSCLDGKPCVGCKKKKVIKPLVYLEDPRPLPVPIVISHYKHKKPVTVNRATDNKTAFWKKRNEPNRPGTAICRWFRKRKALKDLKTEHEKEKQRFNYDPEFRAQKEKEYDFFQEIYKQQAENYQQDREKRIVQEALKKSTTEKIRKPPKEKVIKEKYVKPKKEKVIKEKNYKPKKEKVYKPKKEKVAKKTKYESETENVYKPYGGRRYTVKASTCRPHARSRCVSVKTYNHHETCTERFVNCFYRFCCQLYCCFTVAFLIGVAIIILV